LDEFFVHLFEDTDDTNKQPDGKSIKTSSLVIRINDY